MRAWLRRGRAGRHYHGAGSAHPPDCRRSKVPSEGFARPPWPRPGLGGRPNRLAKAWYGLSSGAGGVGVAVCGWGALRKGAAPRQPRDQALSRATRTRYVKAANMRQIVEVCRPHPTVGQQPPPSGQRGARAGGLNPPCTIYAHPSHPCISVQRVKNPPTISSLHFSSESEKPHQPTK